MTEHRVQFDFEIEFSNGGGLQGQDFRLDIDGETIDDDALAAAIIADLRLLMVGRVRIVNKRILIEQHKRARALPPTPESAIERHIDLSHSIEHGMVTYRGLPAPIVCDYLSREQSRQHYAPGTEFQIGRIDMVANTGTYIDSPFHRYREGSDIAGLRLDRLVDLDAVLVRLVGMRERAIPAEALAAIDVAGKAVLIHTGWAQHWRSERYFEGHPFLTAEAATWLRDAGAVLVGIDSMNIDDTSSGERPVHSTLLGADIPIVEHLCRLERLPPAGFTFTAVPPKVGGIGTFPVRAYATLHAGAFPASSQS